MTSFLSTSLLEMWGKLDITGALYGRIEDEVNLLDMATSVTARSNLRNGGAGLKAAYDLAVAKCTEKGIKRIKYPRGNYELDTGQKLSNPGLYMLADPMTMFYKNGPGRFFEAKALSIPNATTDGYLLTANAGPPSQSIFVSVADAANFVANTYVILRSTNISSGSVSRDAEFHRIRNVNYLTGEIKFYGSLYFSYTTTTTAKIYNFTFLEGVGYENISIDWSDGTPTSPQRPPYNIDEAFVNIFCLRPVFKNVTTHKTISTSIMLHGCLNGYVENYGHFDGYCDGFDMVDAYSYGVAEAGLNKGLRVVGGHSERSRHFYTSGSSDSANQAEIFLGGHPMFSKIAHVHAFDMKAAGGDSHGAGIELEFIDCHVVGARGAGFQMRSRGMRLTNCSARDILPLDGTTNQGHGVYIVGGQDNLDLAARDVRINGFKAYNCYGAGIYDQSPNARGRNIEIERTNLPGIVASGTGAADFDYDGVTMTDVAKSPGGLGAYAVVMGNAAQKNPSIRNLKVKDPNNNLTDGALVRRNDITANLTEMDDVRGINGLNQSIKEASSVTNTDGMIIRGGFGPQSIGPIPQVQIVGDSIDVSKIFAGGVAVLPETGNSDNLSTVTGGERDDKLVIWGTATNIITIVHGSSTNNLFLQGAANVALAPNQCMTFTLRGSVWMEDSERNF